MKYQFLFYLFEIDSKSKFNLSFNSFLHFMYQSETVHKALNGYREMSFSI